MTGFIDTNVLVRHLTGEPGHQARRATRYLRDNAHLFLTDLVLAETVYVLQSLYAVPRERVAHAMRSLLALRAIDVVDRSVLLRALEIYEGHRLGFADAYLVACAESTGVGRIVSFDRGIDRVLTVERIEP